MQTDEQTDSQTDNQKNKQAHRQADRHTSTPVSLVQCLARLQLKLLFVSRRVHGPRGGGGEGGGGHLLDGALLNLREK